MPSKALLRPAQALAEARRVPGAAEALTGSLDVVAALDRRDAIVGHLDDAGQLPWLESHGIELVRGQWAARGRTEGPSWGRPVRSAPRRGDRCGECSRVPPLPGLSGATPWTNREITTTKQAPEVLIVLGGGVVGVEMADAFTSLGSRVVVIEAEQRLLSRESHSRRRSCAWH